MLGVVFVHYRLPADRFLDHFRWNQAVYGGVCPIVVLDHDRQGKLNAGMPMFTLEAVEPMPTFSLSRTKNQGIRFALSCMRNSQPCLDRIAVTDADVAWTPEAIEACRRVQAGKAIVPVYRMAIDYATREANSTPDMGMGGTVCMTAADWRRVCYDETYEGYGGEDGKLRRDMALLGIREERSTHVYHIAHDPACPQVNVPGHGRADCWNRDTINPDNFSVNRHKINGPQ